MKEKLRVWVRRRRRDRAEVKLVVIRKKNHFFHGEVFFILTSPLMGDPFITQARRAGEVLLE
jgi:hypothetical protein